jgi:hypothetical protein
MTTLRLSDNSFSAPWRNAEVSSPATKLPLQRRIMTSCPTYVSVARVMDLLLDERTESRPRGVSVIPCVYITHSFAYRLRFFDLFWKQNFSFLPSAISTCSSTYGCSSLRALDFLSTDVANKEGRTICAAPIPPNADVTANVFQQTGPADPGALASLDCRVVVPSKFAILGIFIESRKA